MVNQTTWIENTKTVHQHGGAGWEFGECLWSPVRANANKRTGKSADRYVNMRRVNVNDAVLHFLESDWRGHREVAFVGTSLAASSVTIRDDEPPHPGEWVGRKQYYRIDLKSFEPVEPRIYIEDFKIIYASRIDAEIKAGAPKNYPFARYGSSFRLAQGNYLATCTTDLLKCLTQQTETPILANKVIGDDQTDNLMFEEGLRSRREATFFIRNRSLVKKVKERAKFRCEVCDIKFSERYKAIGECFIECHHLNPLSERPGSETCSSLTTVEACVALCSNCHRMIHQRRPPFTVAELKAMLI